MIGKVITKLLTDNTDLTDLVAADKIYPYIINEDTPLPAIVYRVQSMTPEYTKDGWVKDDCVFIVESFDDNYNHLMEIAYQVRDALELKRGTEKETMFGRIVCTDQEEGYFINENVYMNRLLFRVDIMGYKLES